MEKNFQKEVENISDNEQLEKILSKYEERIKLIAREVINKNGVADIFSLDELVQAGRIGLMNAMKKYDEEKSNGGSFASFARIKIRGSMIDCIRKEGLISRSEIKQIKLFKNAEKALFRKLKRYPTKRELAEEMRITIEELEDITKIFNRLNQQSLYFEDKRSGNPNFYLNPNVERQNQVTVEYERMLDTGRINKSIRNSLNFLTPRQRECFILLLDGLSQSEISKKLNISESTVSNALSLGRLRLKNFIDQEKNHFLKQYYNDYLRG